ncbi:DUF5677 domain-containing protein [Isoptericola sp. S6320L]|uniref:DUF5677 domain-containing protein n=1 Tax=Isoptericola sp. S6320L TaxID=2926411 RepID=UPI001FF4985E|nr:DUF5677 domain-containing protein [Isoptericola sp. S6320L]MCK0116999.1 DUF5677 domain-containing protein [Isoptericola sp. S6320L]
MVMDSDSVRERLDELATTWDAEGDTIELATRESYVIGVVVFGLTSHCHHLSRGIRALDRAGLQQAAIPLVRQLIECAMTVLWLECYGERAARALMHEHAQNRDKTFAEFIRTGGNLDADTLKDAEDYLADLEDEAKSAGRKFRERCEDIEGGLHMYAFWRIASGESHASTAVCDKYTHEVPESPVGIALSPDPKPGAWDAWLGTSLTMLVLASLAADRFDKTRRRRTHLKAIAREVGTAVKWSRTTTGLKRQRQWEKRQWAIARGDAS